MIGTTVGYAGGTKVNPTYRGLGDHTETIRIEYDPATISYEKLLNLFWESHDPTAPAWSRQYKAVVFYHTEAQKALAEKTRDQVAAKRGTAVHAEILPAGAFYPAEDYHQKHRLRQSPELVNELRAACPDREDAMATTAAARLNAFLDGHGTLDELEAELSASGLSKEAVRKLIDRVREKTR